MSPLRAFGPSTKSYNAAELEEMLRSIHRVSDVFAHSVDRAAMLAQTVKVAAAGTHASHAVVLEYHRDRAAFVGAMPAVGFTPAAVAKLNVKVGECDAADVAFARGSTFAGDARGAHPLAAATGARNALLAQLRRGDESIGVLCLFDKDRRFGGFNEADVLFVETITQSLAVALKGSRTAVRALAGVAEKDEPMVHQRSDDHTRLEVERAEKLGHSLGCLVVEIDGFETITEKYGSQTADLAANQLADCLQRNARQVDVIVRDDAKTLIALLPGTNLRAIEAFWTRLQDQIASQKFTGVGKLKVRHGISCFPGTAKSTNDVVVGALRQVRRRDNHRNGVV